MWRGKVNQIVLPKQISPIALPQRGLHPAPAAVEGALIDLESSSVACAEGAGGRTPLPHSPTTVWLLPVQT